MGDEQKLNYSPDNWAHKALLLMDDADALVRFAAVNMPAADKYTKAAKAFWDVCRMLADEREKLHNAELNGARRASDLSAELGVLAPDWRIGNAKHTDEV